jgi:hypothetical protein
MRPSIQAVADVASSMEAEARVLVVGAVIEVVLRPGGGSAAAFDRILFLFISAGGNKGRPEKPQTAGSWDWVWVSLQLVIKLVESTVGDKNSETDREADTPDVIAVKFVEEGSIEVIVE